MRRINLPLILDTLFAGICAFFIFFTAMRFYTKNAVIGLIFGVCACVLFGALGFLYISLKQNKHLLTARNEKQKKLLSLHLSLSSDIYISNLFKKCLGEEARIRGKRVISSGKIYFFNFTMQPLSEDEVAIAIKYKFNGEKNIFCVKSSPEAAALANTFGIKITESDGVYNLLKDSGLLPEKYVYDGAKKIGFLRKVKSGFTRKICAPLFWSGLSLLALSYFTFFPVYYIASGGVLIILSAIALVAN